MNLKIEWQKQLIEKQYYQALISGASPIQHCENSDLFIAMQPNKELVLLSNRITDTERNRISQLQPAICLLENSEDSLKFNCGEFNPLAMFFEKGVTLKIMYKAYKISIYFFTVFSETETSSAMDWYETDEPTRWRSISKINRIALIF